MVSSPNRSVFQTVIILVIYFTNCKNWWFLCIERSDSLSEGVKKAALADPLPKKNRHGQPHKISPIGTQISNFPYAHFRKTKRESLYTENKYPHPIHIAGHCHFFNKKSLI